MVVSNILNLNLTISVPDRTDEEIDALTHRLLRELRKLDIEVVSLASGGDTPAGATGMDPVTTGTIALAVLPTMLPQVLEFLRSWISQGMGRTIKFKGNILGQQVELEGSLADMEKLLVKLEKKQGRK